MATFGLVHGAYHGAWCWERLTPELEARGHRVLSVDLPCEDPLAGASEYAAAAIEAFADADDDLVLVGHSLGGLSIPLVAQARPVTRLVFLCALVPRPGRAHEDVAADEPDMTLPGPEGGAFSGPDGATRRHPDAAARWSRRIAREVLGVEPLELDAGHSPFLSAPAALAEMLDPRP